jgi:hypothetical protein
MIKAFLLFLLDFTIPRFIEEDVAFFIDEAGNMVPMFKADQAHESDHVFIDYIGRVKSFQIMGVALRGRLVGEYQAFEEWARHRGDK